MPSELVGETSTTKATEVNRGKNISESIFRGFTDPSAEEEEEMTTDEDTEGGASWGVVGSFPNSTNATSHADFGGDVDNHVFSDEPFDSSFHNYDQLQMVREGSLEGSSKASKDESTETGGESPSLSLGLSHFQDDPMAVSVASSDTPATNNLGSKAALKADVMSVLQNAKKKSPSAASGSVASTERAGSTTTGPSPSSSGFYPYNIYQTLAKKDNSSTSKKSHKADREDDNGALNDSRVTASTTASSSARSNKGGGDREVPSSSRDTVPLPPASQFAILDDLQGEAASILSDQQSTSVLDTSHGGIMMDTTASNSIHPYHSTSNHYSSHRHGGGHGAVHGMGETLSVFSARSRGTTAKGKPRYLIRHTLATSQQVHAHPATMLKNIFISIEQERHMYKLAAQHFRAVHNWILFLPAILLSLLSGVVVFVFEAEELANQDFAVYSSILVGVASLVSVFWQALAKQLDLATRATLHDITAGTLKRLSEDIPLTLAATDNIPAEYVALIGEKLGQAVDSCPSSVPHKLESAFSAVSDRMVLMLRPPMGQPPRKHVQKIDFMNLYSTAYDELTTEIIHYWAWPFLIPQPRYASNAALQNFKAIVIDGRERKRRLSKTSFVRRYLCFGWLGCNCCGENKLERSLFDVVPAASVNGDNSNAGYTSSNANKHPRPVSKDNSTPSSHNQHQNYSYPIRNSMLGSEI